MTTTGEAVTPGMAGAAAAGAVVGVEPPISPRLTDDARVAAGAAAVVVDGVAIHGSVSESYGK